jgi:aspartate-semialdehyde dehydrogenase
MDENVPLIVPEVNGEDAFRHKGIISNPNCSTIIAMVAVNGINKLSKIKAINASTYQATSGAGAAGPVELCEQMKAIINGDEIVNNVFQYQIVENLIPQIGSFLGNGYTTEEMKMQNEGRKIMHLPELLVNCTCVRVPVVRSHSISLTVVTEDRLDIEEVKKSIQNAGGTKLYDDPANKIYPMPIITSNQDLVYVGRIRRDIINENGISIWCAGDQVRKGAATNAIQIMMKLVGLM